MQGAAAFLVYIMTLGPDGFPKDPKEWEELGYRRIIK
jgi:hypothetical protein